MRSDSPRRLFIWIMFLIAILPSFSEAALVNYSYENNLNVGRIDVFVRARNSTINIPTTENAIVKDVLAFVMLNISGAYNNMGLEEFNISLISPTGIVVQLHNASMLSGELLGGQNFSTWYGNQTFLNDTFPQTHPSGPGNMDNFSNINSAGIWTLSVVDNCQVGCSGVTNLTLFKLWVSGEGSMPLYSDNTSQTTDTYSPTFLNTFSFKNNTEISRAFIENDFNGTLKNDTITFNTTHYTYQINLPVGTYQHRFLMNGTSNIWNHTDPARFTINKAQPELHISVNGTEADITKTYPNATNVTAWKDFDEGNILLFPDSTSMTVVPQSGCTFSGCPPYSDLRFFPASTHNYTVYYPNTQNYTENKTSVRLTITKAPSTCAISFNPNTPQNYGTPITIFANTSAEASYNSSIQLLQNGTQKTIGNGNQSYTSTPAAGIYNFSAYCSGNENYTESATTDNNYVINKAAPTLTVGFNTTSPQNYGKPILLYGNISAGFGDQSATITIYQNGTAITSGSGNQTYSFLPAAGIYEFNVTYSESQNYMSGSLNQTDMTINKLTPTLKLTLNGVEGNITIASCESINATATVNVGQGYQELFRYNGGQVFLRKGLNFSNITNPCGDPGEIFNYTIRYAESVNYNMARKTYFATIESEAPTYANNATAAAQMNDTHWSANFTIEWTDNKAISNAWLENNFTGAMANATMSGSGLHYYNATLASGEYQYRMMANDTSGNWNATSAMTFTLATTTTTTTTATTTTRGGTGGFPSQQQSTTTIATTSTTTSTSSTTTTTTSETPVIRPDKLPLIRELIKITDQTNATNNEKTGDAITGLVTKNPVAAATSFALLIAIAANYAIGVEPIRHAATAIAKKLGLKKLLKLKK